MPRRDCLLLFPRHSLTETGGANDKERDLFDSVSVLSHRIQEEEGRAGKVSVVA